MTKEELNEYRNEIQKQLKKYDIAIASDSKNYKQIKQGFNDLFKVGWDDCINRLKEISQDQKNIADLWREIQIIFTDKTEFSFSLYHAMNGGMQGTIYSRTDIPRNLQAIYEKTIENVQLLNRIEVIYSKDVMRAVAYHMYIEQLNLETEDVIIHSSLLEITEYQNMPINPCITLSKSVRSSSNCYVFPDICGGLLEKIYVEDIPKTNWRSVFRKKEPAYNKNPPRIWEYAKGINSQIRKELLTDISNTIGSAADIWFFKNVFDPELTVDIFKMVKQSNESPTSGLKVKAVEYNLIWNLCECNCPSVRLYLFEAIKPFYIFVKKYIHSDSDAMAILWKLVSNAIQEINFKFMIMVCFTFSCFKECGVTLSGINEAGIGTEDSFRCGDDFGFIENNEFHSMPSDMVGFVPARVEHGLDKMIKDTEQPSPGKKYVEHIEEEFCKQGDEASCLNKIAFATMSALQERWEGNREKTALEAEDYEWVINLQSDYQYRLLKHLKNNLFEK